MTGEDAGKIAGAELVAPGQSRLDSARGLDQGDMLLDCARSTRRRGNEPADRRERRRNDSKRYQRLDDREAGCA